MFPDWEVIIDDNRCPDTIYIDVNHVDTCFIHSFSLKQTIDAVLIGAHCAQNSQKIPVAEVSLQDVLRTDSIFKDLTVFVNLTCALPND